MGAFWGFLVLLAGLIFAMGLVTHSKDTATVVNSGANALTSLFSLELGATSGTSRKSG